MQRHQQLRSAASCTKLTAAFRHPHRCLAARTSLAGHEHSDAQQWLPPAAWVSGVLGMLHQSVDVDSVGAYAMLLQECVVLQPSLLSTPPAQAAATCWQLERFTRAPAVWFGPGAVSAMLAQHTPASLSQHLGALSAVWLSHGQLPHSFGQLWLQAPSALLTMQSAEQFECRLQELGQLIPELPPCELLNSSASLAGFLLSLPTTDPLGQVMQGHVHREVDGLLLFSHPSIESVRLVEEQQQQARGGVRVVAVYGAVVQPVVVAAAAGSVHQQHHTAPWQQQPERKHTGGVYEQHAPPSATVGDDGSSSSGGGVSTGEAELQLLVQVEVWAGRPGGPPLPVLVLPPPTAARGTGGL